MPVWLSGVMALVILVLVVVAAYYRYKLYCQQRGTRDREARRLQENILKRESVNQSIQILCRALIARQVESSEASLRISALLDSLGVSEQERADFAAIDKMAASLRHIPILEEWQALDRRERRQYEKLIAQKQLELDDFIYDAARKMLGHNF